jgi:hypothetical protein
MCRCGWGTGAFPLIPILRQGKLREPDKIALKISRKLTSRDRDLGGEKGTKKAGACSKVEILS